MSNNNHALKYFRQKVKRNPSKNFIFRLMLFILPMLSCLGTDLFAQNIEFTLSQRRRYDQIYVEIWAKTLNSNAAKIGGASLVIQYNSQYLVPAAAQDRAQTDSVDKNVNQANPIDQITSPFNLAVNGYDPLESQAYSTGYYSLELKHKNFGVGGLIPASTGRGTFVGKLIFDIRNSPADTAHTLVQWSKSTMPGDIRIFDYQGNDIENSAKFTDPSAFTVTGITILSPNALGQVVDRDQSYACLNGDYADGGYPIYFERSVNPSTYTAPVDEDLAYALEYSLDNGSNWLNIGRIAETAQAYAITAVNANLRSGEIYNPSKGTTYAITTENGLQLASGNYRQPLRVIWAKNKYFSDRSEQALIKITRLTGTSNVDISGRTKDIVVDSSDHKLVLGRLFFVQLNGTNEYIKTPANISTSTQLTVEGWVNLNSYQPYGSETGIIASSAGPNATQILGSKEGAWMLYLKNGRIPAFRAREIEGRGANGYLGKVEANYLDSLTVAPSQEPLSTAHSANWVHLAATVNNNTIVLYMNGEIVGKSVNDSATDIRMLTTNHPIWIGVNPNDSIGTTDYLNAGIKGFRVWRIALSQDEIRQRAAGITDPANTAAYGDLRRGLEIYYSLEGTLSDLADDAFYQSGAQDAELFYMNTENQDSVKFRPDRPHIKITAPTGGAGVSNKDNIATQVRWLSYGIGDIGTSNSKDIEIEYSLDSGNTWNTAKDASGKTLGGGNALDVENSYAGWVPAKNDNASANLKTIIPFNKQVLLKVRGTDANTQDDLYCITAPFTVAPYFSLFKKQSSIVALAGDQGMNLIGNTSFIEAWVRPTRFPNDSEAYFPIVSKIDTLNNKLHYALRLLPSGQLQFAVADDKDSVRTATSTLTLVRPNSLALDSEWTHVAVYLFLNSGSGQSEVRFYIDGKPDRDTNVTKSLGTNLKVNYLNTYPTFFGYEKYDTTSSGNRIVKGFEGEFREFRFWSGTPNGTDPNNGKEPNAMTLFIQGAQAIHAENLTSSYNTNLYSAFSFNGSSKVINGYSRAAGVYSNMNYIVRFYGADVQFNACQPYIKLVEPEYKEEIANTKTDVRVRWVGFDYDGLGFYSGDPATKVPPSIEFSIRGGGGQMIQPYQYLGSDYWTGNTKDAMSFPTTNSYRFSGIGSDVIFACNVDASIADPDNLKNGTMKQGPLSASLTNARFRLSGLYSMYGQSTDLQSEGPLFTVTPASNFTVRVLLEGYHDGYIPGKAITNLARSYAQGGLKITLYKDVGTVGDSVACQESASGYDNLDPVNRNAGNLRFANVNFVFTNISDGNYYVKVEQLNHLPVMSRFSAPFKYTGDDRTTWKIESGWDFTSWNGIDDNVLESPDVDPYSGNYFTAYGSAKKTAGKEGFSTTGLIYNDGRAGTSSKPMPAMIAGDVEKDGQINAADRVKVRRDEGSGTLQSDVTGDGYVNADDRTIVDRNFGHVSSVYDVKYLSTAKVGIMAMNPYTAISNDDPQLSEYFNTEYIKKNINQKINRDFTPIIKNDKNEQLLGAVSYTVSAEPKMNGNLIEVPVYITNTGTSFALANCTFALKYNSSALTFKGLTGDTSVRFCNNDSAGYSKLKSAPDASATNPLTDVRTIEIDYDAYTNLKGIAVPNTKTYLGTLCFELKNPNGCVMFNWHPSTSVHSVDGAIITQYGNFSPINPILLYTAALTSPNGGEKLTPSKNYSINWTTTGSANVYVEFSSDNGTTWTRLNTDPIAVNLKTYSWTTPNTISSFCLVRLVDAESQFEIDRSDKVFSIQPAFAQIIRPSSADDVYNGGAGDNIKWTSTGYDKVKFEFSSDGGTTWNAAIASVANASSGISSWKIPAVTTKTAVLRMLDASSGKEVAKTGMFKILNGTLSFRSPASNETLISGRTTRIKWTYSNMANFDMDISYDGGKNWASIQKDVSSTATYYNWTVPAINTSNAVIRAIWNGDPEMEYGHTATFKIIDNTAVDITDELSAVGDVYPNPVKDNAAININIRGAELINVKVYTSAGIEIMSFNCSAGISPVHIPTSGLAEGTYFVRIFTGSSGFIRKFTVVK